jgi:hypothetical protein
LRCDEARRRLLADAMDREAGGHLEGCVACFDALEAADPLAGALRAAQPVAVAAPGGLAAAVVARWHPGRPGALTILTGALVASAIVVAAAIELLAGAEPARLAVLGSIASAVAAGAGHALATLLAVRGALAGAPAALTAFSAFTAAVCVLWLRLATRVPVWRLAR